MDGGQLVAQILKANGVTFLFTLCGGHISPILVGCRREAIRVIDVRHEANAVFAADAVARLTGIPGVAAVTAGPGVTNTITAIKNAAMAHSPLVLLGGATATVLKGRGSLQDIDQMALMKPLTKYAVAVHRLRDLVPVLNRAFAIARSGVPGPVFVELPVDLLYPPAVVAQWYGIKSAELGASLKARLVQAYLRRHADKMFAGMEDQKMMPAARPKCPRASSGQLARARALLEQSQKPVLVIGSQALSDPSNVGQLVEAVEALGLPVWLSGMARGLLGRDHALHLRHNRKQALREADLVLLCGVPCDFRLDYGNHISHRARLISINRDKKELKKNRKPTLAVLADPGQFLKGLAAIWTVAKDWSNWLNQLKVRDRERNQEIARQATTALEFINPLALCCAIDRVLPQQAVLVADGGDFVATASYILQPGGPLSWLDPGPFGTLGVGGGFALGAALCRPDSQVWLIYGDGSSAYSLAEFDTFVRHGLSLIAVIGNDGSWQQIARDQVDFLGDDVGTVLNRCDYHQTAIGYGGEGLLLKDASEMEGVLAQARELCQSGRPVLINAWLGKTDFRKGSLSM